MFYLCQDNQWKSERRWGGRPAEGVGERGRPALNGNITIEGTDHGSRGDTRLPVLGRPSCPHHLAQQGAKPPVPKITYSEADPEHTTRRAVNQR